MVHTQNEPRAEKEVNLAYSTTGQTRQTYLAHQWAEPRSIGTRYAAAIADLSPPQRLSTSAVCCQHGARPPIRC